MAEKKPTQKKTAPKKRTPRTPKPVEKTEAFEKPIVTEIPKPDPEPVDWIRNLHEIPVALRFDSQKTQGARRTELKPRGQRGDITKLKPEDLDSNFYAENVYLAFEPLNASDARAIIEKQTINVQKPIHPAMATLRNELDQPYQDGAVQFQEPAQDIVAGRVEAVNYDTEGNPLGKNFVTTRGDTSPRIATVPGSATPANPDEQADAIARSKTLEGPKAGIGDLRVVVEEVQRDHPVGLK